MGLKLCYSKIHFSLFNKSDSSNKLQCYDLLRPISLHLQQQKPTVVQHETVWTKYKINLNWRSGNKLSCDRTLNISPPMFSNPAQI